VLTITITKKFSTAIVEMLLVSTKKRKCKQTLTILRKIFTTRKLIFLFSPITNHVRTPNPI